MNDILDKFWKNSALRFAFVVFLWAIIYLPRLGGPELEYTEYRRISPSLRMMETGNMAIPEWEGEAYFRKPPLMNWLIVGSSKIFGKCDEFSARFPNAISILLLSVFLLFCPSGFMGESEKFTLAVMLLSTVSIIQESRICEIDGIYMVFTAIASIIWLNLFYLGKRGLFLWLPSALVLGAALLLKGPLALLVFYVLVIVVLRAEKKLHELFSIQHFVAIVAMLAVFFAWFYFVYTSPLYHKIPEAASSTWSSEILYRFNPFQMDFSKWLRRSAGGIAGALPWLILLPIVRYYDSSFEKGNKILNSSLFRSILVLAGIILLMPGTKARYLLPVYPLILLYLAINIKRINLMLLESVWKIIVAVIALLVPILYVIAMLIFFMLPFILKIDRLRLPEIVALSNSLSMRDYIIIIFGFIFVLFYAYFFLRKTSLDGKIRLIIFSALATASIMISYYSFVIPCTRLREKARPSAAIVNAKVPEGYTLKMFDIKRGDAFRFYLKRQVVDIKTMDEILKDRDGFLLLSSESLSELENYPGILKSDFRLVSELKQLKHKYSLIKFVNTEMTP